MSQLVKFLRDGGTLEDLAERFAVKSSRHGEYPNLVQLKYSQIESPMHEPIVQECRGIILDEADGWRVVARGFDKFFNHGEPNAAEIDWASARVQEKVDGSLVMLYFYGGKWQVATTGRPDASGEVNGHGMTFAELFWTVAAQYSLDLETVYTDITLLFELTTPYNRVVVRHGQSRLTFFGGRDKEGVWFIQPKDWSWHFRELWVKEYPLQCLEEVLSTFDTMEPVEQEGYVIVDKHHRRIKVKHPGYVALHHMKDGLSPKTFLEAVRKGESTEVLSHFPELEPIFLPIQAAYSALVEEVQADYRALCHIETQKDFAFEALKRRCSAALFQIRAGKAASAQDYFAACNLPSLLRLLGMKDADAERTATEEA